jgi:uncharacterized repeat protein (TIGR03803 family)
MKKEGILGRFGLAKTACIVFLFCAATAMPSPAQTFTSLVSFDYSDGKYLTAGLVQGTNGNFYGTTNYGGYAGQDDGTVFEITPAGELTTLYNFCSQTNCTDGAAPFAGLVLATNGNFYGTTYAGGANYGGTVFEITPAGELTTLYSFCSETNCTDGKWPFAGLVQASNGNFYGTTYSGGANTYYGTVFEITPAGKLTTLYSFCSTTNSEGVCTDGAQPYAGLVQATNGNLYGTTSGYCCFEHLYSNYGTVFEITPAGKLTTLHSFCSTTNSEGYCTDGKQPDAALVQATNGNFYGTTSSGGASNEGTVFEITAADKLTTLYSFCSQSGCTDGAEPYGLMQANNGDFYGTTVEGGTNGNGGYGYGTVFEITPAGKLTTLYTFCSQSGCTDGAEPYGLMQASNGDFYGTTDLGGSSTNPSCTGVYPGCGTVFSLSVGLGSFVETLPNSGKVGAAIIILGNNLTGATSVTFNGTAATFTVVSSTEITTTVPTGATSGTVEVTTPGGTLKSNVVFRVTPQIKSFTPTSGPAGTVVTVTGVSLTQTTKVTFGGVKATTFTVDSDTQVTATVPAGAKTGKIGITTKGGTAASATSFTVTP